MGSSPEASGRIRRHKRLLRLIGKLENRAGLVQIFSDPSETEIHRLFDGACVNALPAKR